MDFNKIKAIGLEYAEKGKNAAMDLPEKGKTQALLVNEQGKLLRIDDHPDLEGSPVWLANSYLSK